MKNTFGILMTSFLFLSHYAFAASSFYEVDMDSVQIQAVDEDPGVTSQALIDYKAKILLQKREQLLQKSLQSNLQNNFSAKKTIDMDEVNQTLDKVEVATDTIIRTGTKIWNVIEKGKPVINLKSNSGSAVPQGISNWYELENWKAPKSQTYQITYKNFYGYTLVNLKFRVIFMYGGSYKGQGQYIANAQIIPVDIYTFWLCDFNVQTEISEVFNAGTTADPIASMQLFINWQVGFVKSIAQISQKVETFYITGAGDLVKND